MRNIETKASKLFDDPRDWNTLKLSHNASIMLSQGNFKNLQDVMSALYNPDTLLTNPAQLGLTSKKYLEALKVSYYFLTRENILLVCVQKEGYLLLVTLLNRDVYSLSPSQIEKPVKTSKKRRAVLKRYYQALREKNLAENDRLDDERETHFYDSLIR